MIAQFPDTSSSESIHSKDRRAGEAGLREQAGNCRRNLFDTLAWDTVDLSNDSDTRWNAKQIQDFEMLSRLWHDAIVGSHYQHHDIDPGDAREHIPDVPFMSGNVDERDEPSLSDWQCGEAEINRHTPAALFG
jgi:hypothetical protein